MVEGQTIRWLKQIGQRDEQSSTKQYTEITKKTRTPLKTGGKLGCCGRVSRS
jgi:hypothetical protein